MERSCGWCGCSAMSSNHARLSPVAARTATAMSTPHHHRNGRTSRRVSGCRVTARKTPMIMSTVRPLVRTHSENPHVLTNVAAVVSQLAGIAVTAPARTKARASRLVRFAVRVRTASATEIRRWSTGSCWHSSRLTCGIVGDKGGVADVEALVDAVSGVVFAGCRDWDRVAGGCGRSCRASSSSVSRETRRAADASAVSVGCLLMLNSLRCSSWVLGDHHTTSRGTASHRHQPLKANHARVHSKTGMPVWSAKFSPSGGRHAREGNARSRLSIGGCLRRSAVPMRGRPRLWLAALAGPTTRSRRWRSRWQ
ncbi:hypothetical protein SacazDRAFT_04253 [Saccharomonospora azurea NA-128]|uniref:Uncharacterized protein n=1 Tax=Saccharomonospora azurea NA-128 TaxID=882081 RepID=H8GFR4_9PSEU|nr:hypothetical protein SacazDRAFT_04253 [Saccharomonospora azurea NA-128]